MAGPPPEGFRESLTDPRPVLVEEDKDPHKGPRRATDEEVKALLGLDPLDEVRTVSSTGGEKGQKLARFDLVPVGPLTELAKHYGRGAQKYADRNWEKGYEWSKNYAAAQRHLTAFWAGEDIDAETGTPHVIAAAWHCFALAEFMQVHKEFDDRP